MPTISTPFGRWPVDPEGERALESAIQTGERFNFKVQGGDGRPVFLTGRVRRARNSGTNFVLDTGPAD